jgi:hypothetical protein
MISLVGLLKGPGSFLPSKCDMIYIFPKFLITNFNIMLTFVKENNWRWNHCKLPIKRSDRSPKRKQEEYFYQVINSSDSGPIKEDKVRIVLDRPFPFEPDIGFVWHKSWNLPEIVVHVGGELESPRNKQLFCEMMAVYPVKHTNTYYLN